MIEQLPVAAGVPPTAELWLLRAVLGVVLMLVSFLLGDAWREMRRFKGEFYRVRKNHGERLVAIETRLEFPPRRRESDGEEDYG